MPAVQAPTRPTPSAHALSSLPEAAPAPLEYLTFRLGTEAYGIDILSVQEIRGYEAPTYLANAPAFVKGVVNLRGVIVPIVDLRVKFNCASASYDGLTVTIILNVADQVFGVVVDAVSDVVDLRGEGQIHPAPDFRDLNALDCITGLGTLEQAGEPRMLILLDSKRLLRGVAMHAGSRTTH